MSDVDPAAPVPVWVQAGLSEAAWHDLSAHLRAEALRKARHTASGNGAIPDLTLELDQFLGCPDPDYDWIIPGLVEGKDRVIVTGGEGLGKSTLLRQMGVQFSSGIHPFTGEEIDPVRILYIDAENSERQVRRAMRKLRVVAGDHYTHERFRLRIVTELLDLLKPEHVGSLIRMAVDAAPDIIIIGPLYKLASGDPTTEVGARPVAFALDELRKATDAALLIEAHSPYPDTPAAKRVMRPFGWSGWSRWPEFGLHLGDDGKVSHWRGPRDERQWPTHLERSTPWPWMVPTGRPATEPWDGPTHCIDAVVAYFTAHPDKELSTNKLTEALRDRGHKFRDTTITTAADLAVDRKRLAYYIGPRKARIYHLPRTDQPPLDEDF